MKKKRQQANFAMDVDLMAEIKAFAKEKGYEVGWIIRTGAKEKFMELKEREAVIDKHMQEKIKTTKEESE